MNLNSLFQRFLSVKSAFFIIILSVLTWNCAIVPELNTFRVNEIARGPKFAPYTGIKKRIAVFDFENVSGFANQKLGSAIADMLISRLARSGRFILIERSKLNQILPEQALGQSGVVTEETAPEVGKLLGAESIIIGKVIIAGQDTKGGKIDNKDDKWKFALKATVGFVTITYRMISTETGEIIFADRITEKEIRPGLGIETKDYDFDTMYDFDETVIGIAIEKAVNKMALKIADHVDAIEWMGTIVQAKNDSAIYFTPGKASGIQVGQIFNVFDVDFLNDRPKARIESIGFIGDKVTRARLIMGSNINRGDRVKLVHVSRK